MKQGGLYTWVENVENKIKTRQSSNQIDYLDARRVR